jgi:heat shock protein HtpX
MRPGALDTLTRRRQRARNAVQGLLLVSGMIATVVVLAWLVLGRTGLFWVLPFGVFLLLLRPRISQAWLLSMYRARPLPQYAAPELHRLLRVLSQRAGLRRAPALYYVPSPITNAFAVGRADDAAIAVTDGLLRRLSGRQVGAVLAHEISHVRAGDTSIMGFSDALSRLVQGLSYLGMLVVILTVPVTLEGDVRPLLIAGALVVLPSLVTLLQLALSRSREYDADLEAATLTGDPEGLATALEALERAEGRLWERIMVPHSRVPDPLLLRTHPPTAERTRRLRSLVPAHPQARLTEDRPSLLLTYPEITSRPRLRPPGIRW